jgi:uncharacterized protein (DUF697 family)
MSLLIKGTQSLAKGTEQIVEGLASVLSLGFLLVAEILKVFVKLVKPAGKLVGGSVHSRHHFSQLGHAWDTHARLH